MDDDALIAVYSTCNASEAHLVRDILESAGIRAVVTSDIIEAAGARIPCPRVQVHRRDQPQAQEIVAEWRHPQNAI